MRLKDGYRSTHFLLRSSARKMYCNYQETILSAEADGELKPFGFYSSTTIEPRTCCPAAHQQGKKGH